MYGISIHLHVGDFHGTLGIQSPCQRMIGVHNHLLSKVFRFHYHSQKVIGSLGAHMALVILTCKQLIFHHQKSIPASPRHGYWGRNCRCNHEHEKTCAEPCRVVFKGGCCGFKPPTEFLEKTCTSHVSLSSVFRGETFTFPKTNMASWKIHYFRRCISYWTWGFFNVMLVFGGVEMEKWQHHRSLRFQVGVSLFPCHQGLTKNTCAPPQGSPNARLSHRNEFGKIPSFFPTCQVRVVRF